MFLRKYAKNIYFLQNSVRQWSARISSAHRPYQFSVKQQPYYPNREEEMQRASTNVKAMQTQIVTGTVKQKKLPRDYYYRVLGLSKHANMQQIKNAYYTLAKRFHPDSNNVLTEVDRFQDINNAYAILSDETKRLEYDQLGVITDENNFLKNYNISPTELNNNVARPQTPDELKYMTNSCLRLDLTFLEAVHGCKKSLDLSYLNKCPLCNGRAPRIATRNKQQLCSKCDGIGKITKRTPTFTSTVICEACAGKRYVTRNHCENCNNRGIVKQQTKVNVVVPPGTRNDDVISLENPNTKQRVSYRVSVLENDFYTRKGNDVCTEQYISISHAVLGGILKLRGVYDELSVNIEPGTESHTDVRIKGKGIKTRDGLGDHVVTLKIRVPRKLSTKQRQILQALAKTETNPDN